MEEREKNYEVENKNEETNLTTEQESSGGGFWVVAGTVALITGAVVGAKVLWDKFGPKKNETATADKEESNVESTEAEETDSEEAAK